MTEPARTSRDLRRAALLAVAFIGVTLALVAIGILVRDSVGINSFDRHVTTFVVDHRTPALDRAMRIVTWLGSWVVILTGLAIVAGLVVAHRLPKAALVFSVLVVAGEEIGVEVVKDLVRRPRHPPGIALVAAHGGSFPSGHTATAFAVYLSAAVIVSRAAHRRVTRVLSWVGALAVGGAVAFSRVELGVHWTTDLIGSTVFVIAWLAAVIALTPGSVH